MKEFEIELQCYNNLKVLKEFEIESQCYNNLISSSIFFLQFTLGSIHLLWSLTYVVELIQYRDVMLELNNDLLKLFVIHWGLIVQHCYDEVVIVHMFIIIVAQECTL